MNIKQNDIARELGLTVATVSKALRNRPDISLETRARVIEAAQRLGYHLPFHARQPPPGDAPGAVPGLLRVGVLTLSSPVVRWDRGGFVYEILEGLSQVAELHQVFLSLHFCNQQQVSQFNLPGGLPPALQARNLDGLLTVLSFPENILAQLAQDFPCVTVNHEQADGGIDSVSVNLMRDFECALEHFVDLGHRRIGFFSSGRHRFAHRAFGAFAGAVVHCGVDLNPDWMVDVRNAAPVNHEEKIRRAVELTRQEGVTAWLCRTPYLGQQLLQGFHEAGVAVPEDVSVIVHSLGASESMDGVAPTGIEMPLRELGRQALLQLLERRATPKRPARTLLLPGRLVIGNTAGPPPSRH